MSASEFRNATNNGTVNSSDDFKNNQQQCFLVQFLKITFIVGWGKLFFFKKEKGFEGLFSSSSPSYLNRKEEWLVGEPGKTKRITRLLILGSFSDFLYNFTHICRQNTFVIVNSVYDIARI